MWNIACLILINMLHLILIFGGWCSSFKYANILVTGTCEAQVISKGQICIRKHWSSPSCFQRTGLCLVPFFSFPLSEVILFYLTSCFAKDEFIMKRTWDCVSMQMILGEYTLIWKFCCIFQVQAVYNAMRRDDRMKYFL